MLRIATSAARPFREQLCCCRDHHGVLDFIKSRVTGARGRVFCELPGLLRHHSVDASLDVLGWARSCCYRFSARAQTVEGTRTMLYPNRRDVLITLGALASGVAIGEPR
jgi:hypothetical protein